LIDKFRNSNLSQVSMSLVPNKADCKNVAQSYFDEMWVLLYEMGKALDKVRVSFFMYS